MATEQDWPTYTDQAYLAATDTILARTSGGGGVEVAGLHVVARRASGVFMAEGANAAVRASLTGSAEMGGFEIYNGVSHEGSFKSQGSTGETRLSTGRGIGWGGHFTFFTDTTEKMRIAPNGNVGIGTVGFAPAARVHAKSVSEIARFETTTPRGSGGAFTTIYDPTGRKGYAGYSGSDDYYIMNEMNGSIAFGVAGNFVWRITNNGHWQSYYDNALDVGQPGGRIRVVYAGTGAINTSDERDKKWRGAATKAELKAAARIFKELGFYQWLDAIDEKNAKKARYHFGVRAQRVWAIMAEEGLVDAITGEGKDQKPGKTPYAFLCWDEWPEETAPETEGWRPGKILGPDGEPLMVKCRGNEEATEQRPTGNMIVTKEAGNRYGLRPDQLALFLLAAIGDKLDL